MSKVQSSPEVVRQMKADMNKTEKELNKLNGMVRQVKTRTSADWNDAQGEQFRSLMQKVERLIATPEATLKQAQPKLEKLAQSLDAYGKIKF